MTIDSLNLARCAMIKVDVEGMERAGLEEIRYVLLAGGIVAIHAGTVPATQAGALSEKASP